MGVISDRIPWAGQLDCDSETDYVLAGNAHNEYQEYSFALEAFNCALIFDPENEIAFLGRGLAYFGLSKYELAEEDYTAAIALNNESYGYVRRAVVRINLGEYRTAVRDLRYAMQFYAQDPYLYSLLATAYVSLGESDLALEALEMTLNLNPSESAIYLNLGNVYQILGDCEQSIPLYTRVIELMPAESTALKNYVLIHAYVNRGYCQNKLGDNELALEDHNIAIELSPDWAVAYNSRGGIYVDMGRYEEGLSDFDMAIELNPAYWLAYMNKGVTHYFQQAYTLAIQDLENAIEIAPDEGLLYLYLGEVYVAMSDMTRAIEYYQIYETLVDPNELTQEIRERIEWVRGQVSGN